MPRTLIDPVSSWSKRRVISNILLEPIVDNARLLEYCSLNYVGVKSQTSRACLIRALPCIIFKMMTKTGREPVSPRPQRKVLTTILLGPFVDNARLLEYCSLNYAGVKSQTSWACLIRALPCIISKMMTKREREPVRHGHNVKY
uniref:RNA-directed DNA polymerase n=1 Tax=Angiostrongylus cantonensis TaxID=6313 RepID=A0A0K0DRI6_ANGCA